MGIVVLIFALLMFRRRIQKETANNQLMLWGAVLLYCTFSVFLNWYFMDIYGWHYGIPGSDLKIYFNGAVALKNGVPISYLTRINASFDMSITHLGYIAYIVFIAITVFTPVIFTVEISLQLLYFTQCIVAVTTALNIADFFCGEDSCDERLRNRVLWMLLLCASVFQMPCLLMRDIWIIFFVSMLMRECNKKDGTNTKCWIYIFICFAMRYYTLAITLPIYIAYKFDKKKIAAVGSLAVFAVFFVGQGYIGQLAQIVGIGWEFDFNFDLYTLVSFIFFPSPISQAHNVQHLNIGYHANFGGNTEWIYFLLSCWNLYVFPVSICGAIKCLRRDKIGDLAVWGMIIVNIAMLICVFYGGVSSPRHKLLIVISLAFLYKEGIRNIGTLKKFLLDFLITVGIIGLLFITY